MDYKVRCDDYLAAKGMQPACVTLLRAPVELDLIEVSTVRLGAE